MATAQDLFNVSIAGPRSVLPAGPQLAQAIDDGSLKVAQSLPEEAWAAACGQEWYCIGTAVTNLVAIPTTGAQLVVYNGGKNSLIITAVGAIGTATSAAVGQLSVLVRNDVPGANANPSGALIIGGTSGKQYGGSVNAKASVSLAAIGAGNNVAWMPAGSSSTGQATSIGTTAHAECRGRWVVQPNGMFSLAAIAYAASGSSQCYVYFLEVPTTLG